MKYNHWLLLLSVYISYSFGVSSQMVGTMTTPKIIEWYIPYEILLFMLVISFLAFKAGEIK